MAGVKALYCCLRSQERWCTVLVDESKENMVYGLGGAKMAYGLGGVIYILIGGWRKQCPVI